MKKPKQRFPGIGKNKKIREQRRKPIPLMVARECKKCQKVIKGEIFVDGDFYYCSRCFNGWSFV